MSDEYLAPVKDSMFGDGKTIISKPWLMYFQKLSSMLVGLSDVGFTNPMTTTGDIIKGGTDGEAERLGIGSANTKLFVNNAGTGLEYHKGLYLLTGTRTMNASTEDVSYTGVGYKPGALVAVYNATNYRFGVGFTDFSTQATAWVVVSANTSNISTSLFMHPYDTAGNNAAFKTADNDGFTLTWTKEGSPSAIVATFAILCFR